MQSSTSTGLLFDFVDLYEPIGLDAFQDGAQHYVLRLRTPSASVEEYIIVLPLPDDVDSAPVPGVLSSFGTAVVNATKKAAAPMLLGLLLSSASTAAAEDVLLARTNVSDCGVHYRIAPAPDEVCGDRAGEAQMWLTQQAASVSFAWKPPLVNTSPWDEEVFEWWVGEKKLTVYFRDTNAIEYIKVWGVDVDDDMESGSLSDVAFDRLWAWLHST